MELESRCGHAMVYDTLAAGRVDADRLRRVLVTRYLRPGRVSYGCSGSINPIPRPDPRYVDGPQARGAGGGPLSYRRLELMPRTEGRRRHDG